MGVKHSYLASEEVVRYITSVSAPEHEVLRRCREETSNRPDGQMQLSLEQAPVFRFLLAMLKATKALEIGVFTGYSSTLTAMLLPPDGRLIACDSSEEFTRPARRYWREAGVDGKIELRLGDAAETLRELLREGQAGTFDFAFIDADKTSYDTYYELTLDLIRPGGVMLFDNMLRAGRVLDERSTDGDVVAIRALNSKLGRDERVAAALLPITDGMMVAVRV